MSIMAKYARIFWADPRDEDVGARNRAVDALRAGLELLKTREAIEAAGAIADMLAGANIPSGLAARAEKALTDHSPAFVLEGSQQQGVVCLAAAALALVKTGPAQAGGWTTPDAMAAALWSALSLQDRRDGAPTEGLREDLLDACRQRVRSVAKHARSRRPVPDVGTLTIPDEDPTNRSAQSAYKRATAPVIKALKDNADLDREEIDFLWWTLSDYSGLLGCPLADKNLPCRAVAAGIEGSSMLRRLPDDGLRHAVLRLVGVSAALTLGELVADLGADATLLAANCVRPWVAKLPTVFPLLAALSGEGGGGSFVRLDARGWGARALLEAAIVGIEDRAGGDR